MHKLTDLNNILLSRNILKCLAQNNIKSVLEFLQEDAEKLTTITKLNLSQILDIRNDIFEKYSAPLFDGPSLLAKSLISKRFLDTGIERLNTALGGGLPIGYITEICGLAGCGKTQLSFQLAINCSRNTEHTILYIDTKGDFEALRIQKILDHLGCSHQETARVLHKIKIMQIWTMEEIIEFLEKLKSKIIIIENLSLIVIDSLPCLMFQHFGDENKIGTPNHKLDAAARQAWYKRLNHKLPPGLTYLNILVNHCRFLGKNYQISVVCVNIQTRWVEKDYLDFEEQEDQEREVLCIEKYNRCLGKYWQQISSHIILLERIKIDDVNSKNNSLSIKGTVSRSNGIKIAQQCFLNVGSFGVR